MMIQRSGSTVADSLDTPSPGIYITVRDVNGNAATIYSDDGVTPKANPFTSGLDGTFAYWAAEGVYTEEYRRSLGGQPTQIVAIELTADNTIRTDLASTATGKGAALVGTSFGYDLQERLGERVSILEAITPSKHNAFLAGTNADDWSSEVQTLNDQIKTRGGGVLDFTNASSSVLNIGNVTIGGGTKWVGTSHVSSVPGDGGLPTIKSIPGAAFAVSNEAAYGSGSYLHPNCGIIGLRFVGNGAGHTESAIGGHWFYGVLAGNVIREYGEPGMLVSGGAALIQFNLLNNLVMNRTRASQTGALDYLGSDSHFIGNQIGASLVTYPDGVTPTGAVSSANLYIAGLYLRATSGNNWLIGGNTEHSDIGLLIDGNDTKVVGFRADRNAGHGIKVTGYNNDIQAHCHRNGLDNSAGTPTWADVKAENGDNRIRVFADGDAGTDTHRVAYVMHDTYAGQNGNEWDVKTADGSPHWMTARLNLNSGARARTGRGAWRAFTDADTTPAVMAYDNWYWNAVATPFTVTNFDEGAPGQTIKLLAAVAGVSIANNSTIATRSGSTLNLVPNTPYFFVFFGTKWYEVAVPTVGTQAGATWGDVSQTLTVGSSVATNRWTLALTATRTATLSATNASKGDRFTISRTGTGAFNLEVVNGPNSANLAHLIPNSTCVVEFDGTNWFLVSLTYWPWATTVAGLPAASGLLHGTRAYVTDANATTFLTTVAGGGSNKVPVYSNTATWVIG